MEDSHLKVRTHAAHALRAVRDSRRAYGDQLPPILGGSIRGLRACKQRSIVADPTQMRQVMRGQGLAVGGERGWGCWLPGWWSFFRRKVIAIRSKCVFCNSVFR